MTTQSYFVNQQGYTKLLGTNKVKAEAVIDFTKQNVSAADVVPVLRIPKGAFVSTVGVIVNTKEGATCTATVGDGDAAAGWDASTNLNANAGTLTVPVQGTDAYAYGKIYLADDTIDLTMGHDTDAAKITVFAEYSIIEKIAAEV